MKTLAFLTVLALTGCDIPSPEERATRLADGPCLSKWDNETDSLIELHKIHLLLERLVLAQEGKAEKSPEARP